MYVCVYVNMCKYTYTNTCIDFLVLLICMLSVCQGEGRHEGRVNDTYANEGVHAGSIKVCVCVCVFSVCFLVLHINLTE